MRLATAADVPAILRIERASHPEPWSERGFLDEIKRGSLWVLDDVSAYVVMWIVLDEAQIQNITTDPELRRRGLGRALLTEAIALAREQQCSRVTLEVRDTNAAAIALYETLAFKRVGLRKRFYSNGDAAVLMDLTLPGPNLPYNGTH